MQVDVLVDVQFDDWGNYLPSFKYSKGGDLLNSEYNDGLVLVFEDGNLLNETTFDEVRKRASL